MIAKFYLSFVLLLAGCTFLYSQNYLCGNEWLFAQKDSISKLSYAKTRRFLDSLGQINYSKILPRTEIIIPVVIHIVWKTQEECISNERVFSQIEALNRDFNGENDDIASVPKEFENYISRKGIRFCLALVDPQGQPTSGILRVKTDIDKIGTKSELYSTSMGGSDAWDTYRYMNIWVANTGSFLTGFGTFPDQVSKEKEGLVIHPNYFGTNYSQRYSLGRVAVHEAGHYFGLLHTWGDEESCTSDDGVLDTPPQHGPYKGCPKHPQMSCGDADMFMNFMDYVDDKCMVMFSKGQMSRMLNTIEMLRPGLLTTNIPCTSKKIDESGIKFTLYPNPSTGAINIIFMGNISEIGQVEVFNSFGQLVFQEVTVLQNDMLLNLPKIDPGIYWLKIGNRIEKIIII